MGGQRVTRRKKNLAESNLWRELNFESSTGEIQSVFEGKMPNRINARILRFGSCIHLGLQVYGRVPSPCRWDGYVQVEPMYLYVYLDYTHWCTVWIVTPHRVGAEVGRGLMGTEYNFAEW